MAHPDLPPPPPVHVVPPPPPPPTRLPHPLGLFAVALGIGSLAACVVGFGSGVIAFSAGRSSCSPSDGWCDLGAVALGLLAGIALGSVAYIIAGVATIFRSRPTGRRSRHVVAHFTFPIVAFVVLGIIGRVIG